MTTLISTPAAKGQQASTVAAVPAEDLDCNSRDDCFYCACPETDRRRQRQQLKQLQQPEQPQRREPGQAFSPGASATSTRTTSTSSSASGRIPEHPARTPSIASPRSSTPAPTEWPWSP